MSTLLKKERIDIRVSLDTKSMLEKAAEINNLSLSSYIIQVVVKQARIDLEKDEVLILSDKDRDLLLTSLENPWEPNKELRDLFK